MQVFHRRIPIPLEGIGQAVDCAVDRLISQFLLGGWGAFEYKVSNLRGNAGVANTQTQTRKIGIIAECGDDIAQAVVTTVATTLFKTRYAGCEIQLVVCYQNGSRFYFEKIRQCPHCLPAAVHVSGGNQ